MVNKVEDQVQNKDRWYTKSGGYRRDFTSLPQCHEVRIDKPIDESKT
mgnify:CR=1 FL=1